MKLLVTADFHSSREAFEKTLQKAKEAQVDAIIICGDITHFGSTQQATELLAKLVTLHLPILYVSGNTDPPELARIKIENANNLHAKCESVDNYSFIGVGAPHPTFEVPEEKIMQWLKNGVNECSQIQHLIIVAHVPPINTNVDIAHVGGHVGSLSLRRFISEIKPVAVFCGHIHEARGIDYIGETMIVNPGAARRGYCALVQLDEKVNVELSHF